MQSSALFFELTLTAGVPPMSGEISTKSAYDLDGSSGLLISIQASGSGRLVSSRVFQTAKPSGRGTPRRGAPAARGLPNSDQDAALMLGSETVDPPGPSDPPDIRPGATVATT